MIIDAHSHVATNSASADWGLADNLGAADYYVQNLSACGVSKGFAFVRFLTLADVRKDNDSLARARDRYPEVILPWGTVQPRGPEKEIRAEVRRCIRGLGFYGIKLHPWAQGFSLASPGMDVVAEECLALDVPVTFHDGTPVYCTALQVVNLARAYPQLRVLSGHAGLAEQWRDVVGPAKELANYWVCVPSPTTQQGLQALYDALGADKLLFGSDGGQIPPAVIRRALHQIQLLNLPPEDADKILWKNALKLIHKDIA